MRYRIPQWMTSVFGLLVGVVTMGTLFSGCGAAKTSDTNSQTQQTVSSQTGSTSRITSTTSEISGEASPTIAVGNDKVVFETPSYRDGTINIPVVVRRASDSSATTSSDQDGKGGVDYDLNRSTSAVTKTYEYTVSTTNASADPVFHGVINNGDTSGTEYAYQGSNTFHGVIGYHGNRYCPNPDIYTPSTCGNVRYTSSGDQIFQGVQ